MIGKRIKIIEELTSREQFEIETQNRCAKEWCEPTKSVWKNERFRRTLKLLSSLCFQGKKGVDLGGGNGFLLSQIAGIEGTVVDIVEEALANCPKALKTLKRCLPYCHLPEESFDLVLLTDVIAEMEPSLYRLLLSECAALLTPGGYFLCSTPLDCSTYDPLGHFITFLKTEFEVIAVHVSYLRLWNGRAFNRFFLLFLEHLTRILWGEEGISHVIVLCKRKGINIQ